MKVLILLEISVMSCMSLVLVPSVPAQQPLAAHQTKQTEKSKNHRRKVWTNEDLRQLRSTAEIDLDHKLATEETAKLADEALRNTPVSRRLSLENAAAKQLPPTKTLAEVGALISERGQVIRTLEESILRARKESTSLPEGPIRDAAKQTIEQRTGELQEAEAELKILETRLQELKVKQYPLS